MAHGTLDELVPVVRARQAVALLQQAGAQVDYCEDNVGHKLSATCFRSMQVFFEDVIPAET
jgi:predicted esterase